MILLFVFYLQSVATFSSTNFSSPQNISLPTSDACDQKIILNNSSISGITGDRDNIEGISDYPILKRAKRQDSATTSSEQKKKRLEKVRTNNLKEKAINLMQQAMYQAQELIWPLEPLFKRYEKDAGYRMAFVFLKLHTLAAECRSILKVLERRRGDWRTRWSAGQRIQVYWQLMKRNMDGTYLVEFIQDRVSKGTEGLDIPFIPISNATDDGDDKTPQAQ